LGFSLLFKNESVNKKPEIQQPKVDVVDVDDDLPF